MEDLDAAGNAESSIEELLYTLPEGYEYEVESFDGSRDCFQAKFSLKFLNVEELEKWKQSFEEKTSSYYTKRHTSAQGTIYTLKWTLQCYHNTRGYESQNPKKVAKTTDCPSRLIIKMKRPYPGEDFHVTNIEVDFVHNHPVVSAEVSRSRKPTKEITEKFKQLFAAGHSPTSALHLHWLDVLLNYADNFEVVLGDRRTFPDLRWATNAYQQSFPKKSGLRDKENEFERLQQRCSEFHMEGGDMKLFKNGNQFAVAIITPLMMRVSSTKGAGEVIHVVSNRSFEKTRSRLFIFMTSSTMGELPIGVVMVSSETEAMIRVGFTCLQNILPQNAFGERGSTTGPIIFITDNNSVELSAIQGVWPSSTCLISPLQTLLDLWKWIWDDKQLIPTDIRPQLFMLCKNILCSITKDSCKENYFIMQEDFIAMQYPAFVQQVVSLYEKWQLWALQGTLQELIPDVVFSNYSHASVRFIMDFVFGQSKAFTLIQLCDIVKRFDMHYNKRLDSALSKKVDGGLMLKHLQLNCINKSSDIMQIDNETFKVCCDNDSLPYIVDINLYACSCSTGLNDGTCSHLVSCIQNQQTRIGKPLEILDANERDHINWLATGKTSNPIEEETLLVVDSELTSDLTNTILVYALDHSVNEEELSDLQKSHADKLLFVVDDLRKKQQEKPELYGPAIKTFCTSYMNLENDHDVITALHDFGKICSEVLPDAKKRKSDSMDDDSQYNCRKNRAFIHRSEDSVNTIKEHCYSILTP